MDLTTETTGRLDEHTAGFAAEHGVPTVALGVVAGGELVHLSAWAEPGHAMPTADTAYRIASMTKSFTAATVLVLRDRGRLRLDDPVADQVPELSSLRPPTTDAPPLTVRHLLSMAGGLAGDDPWADRLLDADDEAMDRLFGQGVTFAATPATDFVYSNFGYAMLGRLVTNVSGRRFQDFLFDELLEPLGLSATGWRAPTGREVAPAWLRRDGELVPEPVLDDGGFAAMGGLWSTVADLARWTGWLLDAVPPRDGPDGPVLSRASRREMQQVANPSPPVVSNDGDGVRVVAGGYGFGLNVAVDSRLGPMVHHSGGLPGYGSHMRWLPERGLAAVALANLRYAPARELTLAALDLVAPGRAAPASRPGPTPGPDLAVAAEELVALLNRWRTEGADELFSFNVDLDDPLHRQARRANDRLAANGPLVIRSVTALNRAEADVEVVDGRDQPFTLSFMLSPEPRPRIQWYELDEPQPTPDEASQPEGS